MATSEDLLFAVTLYCLFPFWQFSVIRALIGALNEMPASCRY